MNLEIYRIKQQERIEQQPQFRQVCRACFQPAQICYCHLIQKIELSFKFIILIHPLEARRRIATGRMSHLCLSNSDLIRGHDFSENKVVNDYLADPHLHPVILYPGAQSQNLSAMSQAERASICPPGKRLAIFVLDGTWATAKKMLKHSQNLRSLPKICFSPNRPSNFRVRKQPHEGCYSTIEAIHHTIDLVGPSFGFDTATRAHDQLLQVFDSMVEIQLDFIKKSEDRAGPSRYRRARPS